MSEAQEKFLMEAPLDRPVLCTGPPGTGKTVLALYRAALLEKMGQETDFVMQSKLLSRYVRRSLEGLDIDADSKTWHSWVYSHWGKGNGRFRIPQLAHYKPDFMKACELIKQGKPANPRNLYWQNLIIDEGQDFPREFYLFLMVMMSDETIVNDRAMPGVTIFADDNQRMDEEANSTIEQIRSYFPVAEQYEVKENYRNTARIARLARHFFVGHNTGVPDVPEHRPGVIPLLRKFETLEEEMESIVRWLHNNDDLAAGIIVANTKVQQRVVKAIQPLAVARGLNVQMYKSGTNVETLDFYTSGMITVVCDQSCKGLEFDGVFIPQLQHYQHEGINEDFFKMKMYVMISRARSHLQLSFSECDQQPSILQLFPRADEEVLKWEV
ncbi:AAA family ATPase [Pseudomonadales bacterium]|nr:AAA family ATPase [Pseudomonadales bacterium]